MTTANEIREYVKKYFIIPARRRGERSITFKASDIHKAMGLEQRYPLVCSSIDTDKFLEFASVILVKREGPKQSTTARWTFDLS
jgi:5-methylcytosine-specific restriction protein B